MVDKMGTVVSALFPTTLRISLPFGLGHCWRHGEDPGDTASAVSGVATKAADPTKLWAVGCKESILRNGMFQSREVMSKVTGGSWAPGPHHCPYKLPPHAMNIGQGPLEAASGQGRGPAGLQGDHNTARSTGSGFCVLGATSSDGRGTRDQGLLPHFS